MTTLSTSTRPQTVRDTLVQALRAAAAYNPADVAAPLAVLWPDAERAWAAVAPTLGGDVRVLTLGEHEADRNRGPVPWLRIQTALREGDADRLPVVYLPGVSRKELMDPGRLREDLQPLAGLVVRSAVFAQRNGSDWTPSAFLTNDAQGLGLTVSGSRETREALGRSLPRVLECRVSDLGGRTLGSSYFDKLLVQDPPRRVLTWLGSPEEQQAAWEADGSWAGFVSLVRKEYKVHPITDGRLAAARKLGDRDGKWTEVWTRFAEAPHTYPGVVDALRMARPAIWNLVTRDTLDDDIYTRCLLRIGIFERTIGATEAILGKLTQGLEKVSWIPGLTPSERAARVQQLADVPRQVVGRISLV